jgi:hypothetical protein
VCIFSLTPIQSYISIIFALLQLSRFFFKLVNGKGLTLWLEFFQIDFFRNGRPSSPPPSASTGKKAFFPIKSQIEEQDEGCNKE